MNRSTIASLIVLLASASGHAATIHVSSCGSDSNAGTTANCGHPNGPKATLLGAITAAASGDEILVHPGVYAGVITMPNKQIVLRSVGGPGVTTIIGGGGGVYTLQYLFPLLAGSIIDGFTFTGATGGALRVDVNLDVRHSVFVNNTTTGNGAAIQQYNGSLAVSDCVFDDNASAFGSTVNALGGTFQATRCVFKNAPASPGAGAFGSVDVNATFTDCTFLDNMAAAGSAIRAARGQLNIERCWFSGNVSSSNAGAVSIFGSGVPMQVNIRNSVFSGNHSPSFGGAVSVSGNPVVTIDHCTFDGNTSAANHASTISAFGAEPVVVLRNSIVRSPAAIVIGELANGASSVSNCILTSAWTGAGSANFVGDPIFVDAAEQDFRLMPGSPAIDAAAIVAPALLDYLRHPRAIDLVCVGAGPDIGAIEVQADDFNVNMHADVCEILNGTNLDCSQNGVLDSAEQSTFPLIAIFDTTGSPQRVVGAPDDSYIGVGANQVTLDFGDRAVDNGPGADLTVYEVDFGAVEFGVIDVLVSDDGANFISVKGTEMPAVTVEGDDAHGDPAYARSYDIGPASLANARYVRISARTAGSGGAGDGFDLDAVGAIHAIALPACPSQCVGDANGDGVIDFGDLNITLSMFNSSGENLPADFDDDGDVDFADLNALLSVYNTPCL